MSLGPKNLIEQQIPYHIREASPMFVKFLEYYYEFNEEINIQKAIQDVLDYNNCDKAEEQFIRSFFEELKLLPHNIATDRRLVAKHIYDIYQAKGSERAVKLLFQIVFGERVHIQYPSEQILRASDGKWIQDSYITLRILEGNLTESIDRIEFNGSQGYFSFTLNEIEQLNNNFVRVQFNAKTQYSVDGVSRVFLYSGNELVITGSIEPMPSIIQVEDGGAYWQLGQIIVLPGQYKDTIVQIERISEGGEIKTLKVVQFGHGYDGDQVFVVSPFKYKPTSSYTEQYTEKLTDSPPSYAHTLNIFDITDGISENVLGLDSDQTYVLEGYVLRDYINRRSIIQTVYSDYDSSIPITDITIDQWLASRSRIRILNKNAAISAGYYANQDGMISVPDIRLQDSFFYQIFSYVIETGEQLKTYKPVLNKVHPAGFKYFSNLTKISSIDAGITSSRILSRENVLLSDTLIAVDENAFIKEMNVNYASNVKATDIDVANNYDANNELEYFSGTIDGDWDLIRSTENDVDYDANEFDSEAYAYTGPELPYDAAFYDAENYGETGDLVDQYTREDEAVVIQKN